MLPTFHITLATHLAEMDPLTQKSTESFPPIFIKDIILPKITDCFSFFIVLDHINFGIVQDCFLANIIHLYPA